MPKDYSLDEAHSKLSKRTLDRLFAEMDARGESYLVGGRRWAGKLRVGRKYVPGALKRFLADR